MSLGFVVIWRNISGEILMRKSNNAMQSVKLAQKQMPTK